MKTKNEFEKEMLKVNYSLYKNKPTIVIHPPNKKVNNKILTNHVYLDSMKNKDSLIYHEGYLVGGLNE